jgi:hypothetical protein
MGIYIKFCVLYVLWIGYQVLGFADFMAKTIDMAAAQCIGHALRLLGVL